LTEVRLEMHHTRRAQAVRRAQERAGREVRELPWIVRITLGAFIYGVKEARYEREEIRRAKG
jgi:hypothetical protein